MPKPLRWNTPAFRWNAPAVIWNGVEGSPRPMSNIKAIVDFTGYTAGDLGPVAQNIHDSMTAAAATFPTPPVTMVALQTSLDDFNAKLAARASRASADVIAFTVARHELEGELSDLGNYVNIVAGGDPVIVDASGFPSYDTARTVDTSAPAAPTDLRLRQGELSGSLVARYRPDRARSINQLQTCTGDPNVEANWKDAGMFSGGKAPLSGFTPGATVWVRARTVGLKGVMGAWSDPAKIMVV